MSDLTRGAPISLCAAAKSSRLCRLGAQQVTLGDGSGHAILNRYNAFPELKGGNEATRNHYASLQRGYMAACSSRAEEGDAGDWLPWRRVAWPICPVCGSFPPGIGRVGPCRGTKRGDRIPL